MGLSSMAAVATEGTATISAKARLLDDATGAGLLHSALASPSAALFEARRLLGNRPHPSDASYAHQSAAIVLRDRGDTGAALRELRAALRCAQQTASREREADVRATLGLTLVVAGRAREGLLELNTAAEQAHGVPLARIRLRRATALVTLGRHEEALDDLRRALVVVRRGGDRLWQARILNNRGFTHVRVGALSKAADDAAAAERLYDELGHPLESARARHNAGIVAALSGDIPAALRALDLAQQRYAALGFVEPDLVIDTGHALLAAGLAAEAVGAAAAALSGRRRQPTQQAELLLFAAAAALADDQLDRAQQWAARAHRLFAAQQRPTWDARAQLLGCRARFRSGDRSARLLRRLIEVSAALEPVGAAEAATAHLLAGQLSRYRGDEALAREHLVAAARFRRRGAPLARATGWLGAALQVADDDRALLIACGRGLDALDEHRNVFGAAEFRATATAHGSELADLAVDAVVRRGSPRAMLLWSERWRATALLEPATRAPHELPAPPRGAPPPTTAARESDLVRARLQVPGAHASRARLDLSRLLDRLGAARLVVLVPSRGVLHAVVAAGGRCTRHVVGPVTVAERELDFARFELQRAARGGVARASLRWRQLLQEAVLGPVVPRLGDAPVVIVPPASLHAVPWALFPAFAQRSVSVAPSAASWLRAADADQRRRPGRGVLLALGPGLQAGAAEIARLARVHPSASVLGADAGAPPSDVDDVLAGLEGARLAHVAAHGTFRADSPLFSSLALDDGPLFVHDLERVRRLPHRVVLSACDTGVAAPVGADELLGLVSSLLRLGSVGVLASVVPVNDEASAPFMVAVHQALAAGRTLAEAALVGRTAAGDDPLAVATAGSFSVWGV